MRTLDSNVKVMNTRIATTESYRDREGNWQDQTEWHNIVAYRYLAEKNIAKGDLIYVEGKIKNRKYTDKDGVDKYFTEIQADKMNILARSNQTERSSYQSEERAEQSTPPATETTTTPNGDGDAGDLPF